jgi:HAD superfamily hydrolase (TIGR01549 family)
MIDVPAGRRLIILDLDGTLVVLPIDWQGMKQALAEAIPDVSFAQLSAGVRTATHRYGASGRRTCFEVIRRFERESLPGMAPVREVLDLVAARRGEARFAICSNNLHETIDNVVGALGLRDTVGPLVGRDDVVECKPDPEGLLKILDDLRVLAVDAVFIGNHSSDAAAGARAGIQTILIEGCQLPVPNYEPPK